MKAIRRSIQRIRFALGRRNDAAMHEEFEAHIAMQTDENLRAGMTPQEARRQAVLKFGGVDATKERYRDQRSLPFVDMTMQDLRYAFRGIRNNPGFAAVAILSLAIGIGANTAIFSLVNSVLLQPLAYEDPERLFAVNEINPDFASLGLLAVNPMHAREWGESCPSLEGVSLMRTGRVQLSSGTEPLSVRTASVQGNLLSLLGVQPILGRSFLPEEEKEGNDRVVMLSESLWRAQFQADRSLVSRSIVINGVDHQVVGIVPSPFQLPYSAGSQQFDIFRPLALSEAEWARRMGNYNYAVVIRLKKGVTPERGLAEINVVQARFREDQKAAMIPMHELLTGRARTGLWMLAVAVGAVLLIVCVNLANLLLSRMSSRAREAAIRSALGASRGRQMRQVLTESLVLALSGGILAVVFASGIVQLLVATTTLGIPRINEVRVDAAVLLFAFGLTLLTGLGFGALPALRFTRSDPQEALRAGSRSVTEGRRGLRLREGLISLEVGVSTALLIVAGLLGTSLTRLVQVDKGFDSSNVLTVDVSLAANIYSDELNRHKFFDRLLPKLNELPGVQSAGAITALPVSGNTWNDAIYLEGATRPSEKFPVDNRYASPGYFRTMNIAIRHGRAFDENDRGQGVAVLSEKAARLLWPGEANPVGRMFMGEDDKIKTLVGIVGDVRASLASEAPATAYYPYWQRVPGGVSLVLRTTGDPMAAAGALRAALRSEDASLAIPAIRTMDDVVDLSIAQRRFQMTLMAAFALSALVVASLGIYGVVSYSVARRRNEIGLRMALGAHRTRLLALVLRQGMTPVVIGLAAGVAIALLIGDTIRGLLFGVQPTDPLTIAAVMVILLVVAVLACLIPARRATKIDVLAALRFE